MRTTIIVAILGVLSIAGTALLVNTQPARALFGVPVGPYAYNSDVNRDGRVNSIDTLIVAKNQGLSVPAPTAVVPPTTYFVMATLGTPSTGCADPTQCIATAFCDTGDPVTGGGTDHLGGYSPDYSAPVANGWSGRWYNANGGEKVWAVCLDNPPYRAP